MMILLNRVIDCAENLKSWEICRWPW